MDEWSHMLRYAQGFSRGQLTLWLKLDPWISLLPILACDLICKNGILNEMRQGARTAQQGAPHSL